ncbi:MAG: ABC transporter permease [Chloroflexota bacterium]|nr:ABC transporter permease [Chloroflexota bacterium]
MAEVEAAAFLTQPRPGALLRFVRVMTHWPILPGSILTVLIVAAVFAPLLTSYPPLKHNLRERNLPPGWYAQGTWSHPFGTDIIGRDVLSRLMHGARLSLMVAAVALVTGTVVGTALGLIAGYFGGLVEEVIMRLVDIWLGLPFVLVAMVIAVVLGPSLTTMMAMLALLTWPGFVRNVRAEVLSLRSRDYVSLAKVAGASTPRILAQHILPGVLNTVMVLASLRSGQLILAEAFLSFLGAGIPPPTPTWGSMIADGRNYLRDAWWISVFPGLAIFLTVLSLNFFGDWVRDHFDPRLRQL